MKYFLNNLLVVARLPHELVERKQDLHEGQQGPLDVLVEVHLVGAVLVAYLETRTITVNKF